RAARGKPRDRAGPRLFDRGRAELWQRRLPVPRRRLRLLRDRSGRAPRSRWRIPRRADFRRARRAGALLLFHELVDRQLAPRLERRPLLASLVSLPRIPRGRRFPTDARRHRRDALGSRLALLKRSAGSRLRPDATAGTAVSSVPRIDPTEEKVPRACREFFFPCCWQV